ncbi:hypothetical protein FRC17_010952 [Serendipita sp. 399]|nr:hypothetical protein FRC17_010952 [Serendipita sp. 399]
MASPPNSSLNVLIVGNGIAGPVLAMALQKVTQYRITLVDGGSEDAAPIGGGVAISPNGMKALKFIGADQIVLEEGGSPEQFTVCRGDLNTPLVVEQIRDAFVEKYGYSVYGILRQTLCGRLRALAKERGIDMRYGLKLTNVEESEGHVQAQFANGQTMTADLLIACDGLHSVARRYVMGDEAGPRFSGASLIIGVANLTPEEEKTAELKGFTAFLGSSTMFLCIPVDKNGTWMWANGFPTVDPAGGEAEWNKGDHTLSHYTQLCSTKVEGWKAVAPKVVLSKAFRAIPLGIYDRPPSSKWYKGRVVLCGDAVHPTTPVGGQGAQMAMESAVILARLLAENGPSDETFTKYTELRRPRTDTVTQNARFALINLFAEGLRQKIRDTVLWLFGGFFMRSVFVGPLVVKELKRIVETSEIVKEDDSSWPKPNIVGKQELEIRVGSDHISFHTAKIGSLMDVSESEDPEGLRVFYYLVQDIKIKPI